jgi:hypothetical protein
VCYARNSTLEKKGQAIPKLAKRKKDRQFPNWQNHEPQRTPRNSAEAAEPQFSVSFSAISSEVLGELCGQKLFPNHVDIAHAPLTASPGLRVSRYAPESPEM